MKRRLAAATVASSILAITLIPIVLFCISLSDNTQNQTNRPQDASQSAAPIRVVPEAEKSHSNSKTGQDAEYACQFCGWMNTASPADWVLVMLGWGGILAALYTLTEIKDQSKAAGDSASAALTSSKTEMMGGRAYLVFSEWKVRNALWPEKSVELSLTVKNVGNTPAIIVSRHGRIAIDGLTIPAVELSDKPSGKTHVLPPQSEFTLDIPTKAVAKFVLNLDKDVYQLMKKNERFLYGFFRVTYRDVFGKLHSIRESARCIYFDNEWVFPSDQRNTETDDDQPHQQQSQPEPRS